MSFGPKKTQIVSRNQDGTCARHEMDDALNEDGPTDAKTTKCGFSALSEMASELFYFPFISCEQTLLVKSLQKYAC